MRINNFLFLLRTVRTWDVKSEKKHKSVFKPRSFQGKKVIPICCTYSRDGKLIAAGCQDGSIQIWDRNLSVSLKTHMNFCNAEWVVNMGCLFSYGVIRSQAREFRGQEIVSTEECLTLK